MEIKNKIRNIKRGLNNVVINNNRLHRLSITLKMLLNNNLKNTEYNLFSVKDYCELKKYKYRIIEEEQLRKVYTPKYYKQVDEKVEYFHTPAIYLSELFEVTIVGANSFILAENLCLYDLAVSKGNHRYNLNFQSLRILNNNKAIIQTQVVDETLIHEGIFLIGFASWNYFHFSIEIVSKLQYIDQFTEYRKLPLLVDEVVLNTPQYKELLEIVNIYNHPVIYLKKNQEYKILKLIYVSPNSWMPINLKFNEPMITEDSLIALSAVEHVRRRVLNNKLDVTGYKKIFISRRNMDNYRLINENEVRALFEKYGFEIVYPEKMSFLEQVKVFNEAEYIVASSGAALTNILYCPLNVKIICIIPSVLNFNIYSSMANLLDLNCIFLDARVYNNTQADSGAKFILDLEYCKDFLDATFL